MTYRRTFGLSAAAAAGVLTAFAAFAGVTGTGTAAQQAPPSNQTPPTISGTPQQGSTLTAGQGAWAGTTPMTFAFQWRRCDDDGGSCSNIGGARERTYTLRRVDVGNTLRVQVTATNRDGSASATSVPTAVVRPAPARPTGCQGNAPLQVAGITPPNRLNIDGQQISPPVVRRGTTTITVRFHVSCDGKAVQGALVYGAAVPFNQFSPAEQATGADGWAELRMSREGLFPASDRQQLLVVFARARKPGEPLLGGISTRRLVSFPVSLR